jgi:rubrerythrin
VSRIPRIQEHLKTGFTSEAVSAAKFRAYAHRARRDGLPNLAGHWEALANEKDELARIQLEHAGKIRGGATDVGAELAEDRYENEVLYPKLIQSAGSDDVVGVFQQVIEAQKDHLRRLDELRRALGAAEGDVGAPEEAEAREPVTAG